MRGLLLVSVLSLIPVMASAQAKTDAEIVQEAVGDTKDLMTNPDRLNEALKASPEAKHSDDRVRAVAGSKENADEIYAIAADLIDPLMKQAGNDPKKMEELLKQASQNPAMLEQMISPEQKARIEQVAGKIDGARAPSNAKP